jgi:integrase/recombinase XerD
MGTDPSRVAMSGPLTPFAAGFAGELAGRGHAPGVVAVHLRLMAHLSRWLEARALGPADLGPSAVGSFVAVRRAAGCSSGRTAGSLAPLLGYLRAAGAATIRARIIAAIKDAGYLHVLEGRRDHSTPAETLRLHGLD